MTEATELACTDFMNWHNTTLIVSRMTSLRKIMLAATAFKKLIYLFVTVVDLGCCVHFSLVVARALSSCGSRALEHRLSSCGPRAQLLCGMWDLSRSEIEPVSPALAGGFFTTEP